MSKARIGKVHQSHRPKGTIQSKWNDDKRPQISRQFRLKR